MTTKTFHLGDILSVTTERLVSPRHIDGVYDILNWMTGDSLFTHQIPRANDECRPHLLAQHPDLADIDIPEFRGAAHVEQWLAQQVSRFGEYREVAPLADGDHTHINPLDELAMNYPNVKVLGVVVPDGDDR